jgi:DNA-binding transcriptional regulator YiaG
LLGIGAVSVSKWESGKFKPSTKGRTALIAVRKIGRREARRRIALSHVQRAP